MMFTTARLLILAVCAAASNVNIHHRILVPGAPELPFVERGVIDNLRFQPSSTLSQHWLDFETALESLLSTPEVDLDRVLYQVALEREGADRDVSSVKLCHIPLITFESIILHTPHLAQNNAPYAINYFVTPIPDDGACPRLGSGLVSLPSPFQALSKLNTTIIHKADTQPPQPQLRAPPQLTAEGAPVQPPPEKSFVQKYWMYIVAVLFALLMTGGGSEEEGQSRAST